MHASGDGPNVVNALSGTERRGEKDPGPEREGTTHSHKFYVQRNTPCPGFLLNLYPS